MAENYDDTGSIEKYDSKNDEGNNIQLFFNPVSNRVDFIPFDAKTSNWTCSVLKFLKESILHEVDNDDKVSIDKGYRNDDTIHQVEVEGGKDDSIGNRYHW